MVERRRSGARRPERAPRGAEAEASAETDEVATTSSARRGRPARGGARRRPAAKKGLHPGVIVGGLAGVAVLGVVLVLALGGKDDPAVDPAGDPSSATSMAGVDAATRADQSVAATETGPKSSGGGLFDADSAAHSAAARKEDRPRVVVDRDPTTIDTSELQENRGQIYVSDELEKKIAAFIAKVESYRLQRYDVSDEMKKEGKDLVAAVRDAKRDPFLSAANLDFKNLNTRLEKSELHRKDKAGNLFPRVLAGFVDAPYALYVQQSEEGGEAEIAARMVSELRQLNRAFTDYFSAFIDLEEKKKEKKETQDVIKVLLLRSHRDYQNYNRIRNPDQDLSGALAHYEPDKGLLVVPLTYGGEKSEADAAHQLREVMFHEATHQLLDYYTGQKHLSAYGAMWSDEGVAEYFAGHVVNPDGTIAFGRVNSRIKALQHAGAKGQRMDLVEVLKHTRYQTEKLKDENKGLEASLLQNAVYAQGWALVYFFNNYKDGLYEKAFHEIMRAQIDDGDAGVTPFKKAIGGGTFDEDKFRKFKSEFEAFLDYLMELPDAKIIDGVIPMPAA